MFVLDVAVCLTSWFLILFLDEYFASNNRLVRMPPVAKRDRVRENQGWVNRDLEFLFWFLLLGLLSQLKTFSLPCLFYLYGCIPNFPAVLFLQLILTS